VSGLLVVAATEAELTAATADLDARRLACGVGPVEAAAATARALAAEEPIAVLHVGIAGCRRGCGLAVPLVVIGSEAVYDDMVSTLAPRRVAAHPRLLDAARAALPDARVLPIGTSGLVGGTRGHDVEAMEGFAVLRACELAGVPAIEVRVLSNEIEDERDAWRVEDALAALARAVPALAASFSVAMSESA